MSLIKWNPANEMGLFRDFDSIFNDFFLHPSRVTSHGDVNWAPRVDVVDKKDHFQLIAELPGLDKKDIDISVKDDVLTISGEKKVEESKEKDNYYCCERRFGKFERSFRIAENVDAGKISAEYKNGVLTVSVPKTEEKEALSKKIAIK